MATFTPGFHTESETIHFEHRVLLDELAALDSALDHLESPADPFASLATAKQVEFYGKQLAEKLPEHFRREEETILATVAQISPELKAFAAEMKLQHEELRVRFGQLQAAVEKLQAADDLDDAIAKLKEQGKELTRLLGRHVSLEETELSGFL